MLIFAWGNNEIMKYLYSHHQLHKDDHLDILQMKTSIIWMCKLLNIFDILPTGEIDSHSATNGVKSSRVDKYPNPMLEEGGSIYPRTIKGFRYSIIHLIVCFISFEI